MSTRVQLRRFLLVGSTTVLVDFATYSAMLAAGLGIDPAKGLGFIIGTIFAYLANRHWTFEAGQAEGRLPRFLALYLTTLVVNVGVNAGLVASAGTATLALGFAFVMATGVSASLNFLGMKYIVFRS